MFFIYVIYFHALYSPQKACPELSWNHLIRACSYYQTFSSLPSNPHTNAFVSAVVDPDKVKPIAADDAADAGWFTVKNDDGNTRFVNGEIELTLKDLAFDHDDIMMDALDKV